MTDVTLTTLDDVYNFWFGATFFGLTIAERNSVPLIQARAALWFMRADPNFETVQMNHKHLIEKYASEQDQGTVIGDYTPQQVLGKIILFDQFSRCVFRGTPLAFHYDKYAN